jgi:hypothetical protein
MVRYVVETRLSPRETIDAARSYFRYGLGLKMTEPGPRSVYFEGGGGDVRVTVGGGDSETSVALATNHWDYFVELLTRRLGRGERWPATRQSD